jgi:hypothetical protein
VCQVQIVARVAFGEQTCTFDRYAMLHVGPTLFMGESKKELSGWMLRCENPNNWPLEAATFVPVLGKNPPVRDRHGTKAALARMYAIVI